MPTLVIKSIPEALHARLKQAAIEHRRSLTQEAIVLLEKAVASEKAESSAGLPSEVPYFARRKLLPGFKAMEEAGAFTPKPGDRDITDLISDDRDGR